MDEDKQETNETSQTFSLLHFLFSCSYAETMKNSECTNKFYSACVSVHVRAVNGAWWLSCEGFLPWSCFELLHQAERTNSELQKDPSEGEERDFHNHLKSSVTGCVFIPVQVVRRSVDVWIKLFELNIEQNRKMFLLNIKQRPSDNNLFLRRQKTTWRLFYKRNARQTSNDD